jgi:hypothetical protein
VTEADAFLGDLAQGAQGEDLEAAGVGEDGAVPGHELVQAAEGFHHLQARAKPQVEGVAEADLGADVAQIWGEMPLTVP